MKHKIEIYTDIIYYENEKITDAIRIAEVINRHISHLGKFDIYIRPKPKTFFQKLLMSLGGDY